MHVVWLHGRSYYDQVMIYLRKAIPMAASSFSSKTFNIRTQIRIDQASELGKKIHVMHTISEIQDTYDAVAELRILHKLCRM